MRFAGYQAGPRWQGVRLNIALISTYLHPNVKTAIDIGSNEGIITCAMTEMGITATGYEQNSRYNKRALRLAKHLGKGTQFQEKLVSDADLDAMGDVDAIMFLSVHHQIAAHNSLEDANSFLCALARKAKHQFFFQPACIKAKYGCDVPFEDNDFGAIEAYFKGVLEAEMPYSQTVGFAQNDMPKSEPLRPMMIFGREPVNMNAGRDTAGILKTIGTAVDKVHTIRNAITNFS